jgi:3-hydroxyisobutyrate dehydrogenase
MSKAGVIGLGVIGSGVSLCLARAGLLGAVYDIRRDASDGLEGVPAVAVSPAEVARQCDVVIVAVVSADQVVAVLEGPDGVLAAARPGLAIVLVATVAMDDLVRIRALTDVAGVGLVDCGVTGGQLARQNGLVCLVGATPEHLAIVKPVLDGFAKSVAHMGGPGAGMAAKIARNVVVFGCIRAGYEGAALARAAGVDVQQLAQVIEASSDGVGGPMMLMGRPADPFTDPEEAKLREYVCNLMNKDLDAALDLGKSLGVGLPLIELVRRTDRVVTGLELAKENAK